MALWPPFRAPRRPKKDGHRLYDPLYYYGRVPFCLFFFVFFPRRPDTIEVNGRVRGERIKKKGLSVAMATDRKGRGRGRWRGRRRRRSCRCTAGGSARRTCTSDRVWRTSGRPSRRRNRTRPSTDDTFPGTSKIKFKKKLGKTRYN